MDKTQTNKKVMKKPFPQPLIEYSYFTLNVVKIIWFILKIIETLDWVLVLLYNYYIHNLYNSIFYILYFHV